jgi:hypothetical protein
LTITMAVRHSFQTFDSHAHSSKPQSLRPRSVHHVELMAERQDLKPAGPPVRSDTRRVRSNETTTDRIVGPYPRNTARSMFSRRTRSTDHHESIGPSSPTVHTLLRQAGGDTSRGCRGFLRRRWRK